MKATNLRLGAAEDKVVEYTKVLVVDQDQEPYETLKQGLLKYGYEIHTTDTIAQALALARAYRYKVAFVSLPLVHGTALLAGLHAEIPNLLLILVLPTTHVEHIPAQAFKSATNAIGKPLTFDTVRLMLDCTLELATLRSHVRQHRQAWHDIMALQCAPGAAEPASNGTPRSMASFEAMLTSKLRHMLPGLEALGRSALHDLVLSHVEKLLITVVLNECRGNQLLTAKILGINRNTLRKKIHEYNIPLP
jgi:DNA-binding NtrC family response regulator